jgi:glyoxylase-like metal-dependent hydrolase (beta-lactamase superfamily II)
MKRLSFRRASRAATGLAAVLLSVVAASAQFDAPTVQAGPKLAPVTVLPAPGVYANTTGIALQSAESAAEIHYTWDGSKPTAASPKLERGQLLFIAGVYGGETGLRTGYTIRAVAMAPGHTDSDTATFVYNIERRDRTTYVSEELAPGVRMIRDSDNDKMFLVRGSKAFALIDSGMGHGALRDYVAQFTGGLPVINIYTHSHGDHIGQAKEFIATSTAYVGAADRPAVAQFLCRQGVTADLIDAHLKSAADGDTVDLGDRKLQIYAVAGHTPGSIVIFDPATGNLFTGDSVGNNSALPPDVMWMQFSTRPLDAFLANERYLRARLGDRVKRIMTGHNDRPLAGTAYLDHLERAIQRGLDEGESALIPSWRPAGIWQLVEGDRFSDPNWFGVNVNRKGFLPASPDRIAGLTALSLSGASLTQVFDPTVYDYHALRAPGRHPVMVAAIPTSARSHSLTIGGRSARAGVPVVIAGKGSVLILVVAPDGRTNATYRITFDSSR